MEELSWNGTYEENVLWPVGTTEEEKQQVQQLAEEMEVAEGETALALRAALEDLPRPFPNYELCLHRGNETHRINVWHLCYQVCFLHYTPDTVVEVDPCLLDEAGEVDWLALDAKAHALTQTIFQQFPAQ
jgi:hypothetical protein